jgi:hypothetical protein
MKSKLNAHSMFALLCAATALRSDGAEDLGGNGPSNVVPMTDIEIRINGVSGIKYQQPATVEAYDTLAKVQGRCLADACSKQLFHGSYGDIRAGITDRLRGIDAKGNQTLEVHGTPKLWIGKDEVTEVYEGEGEARKLTGYVGAKGKTYKTDADVKVEADKAFFDRVCAEKGVEPTHFTALIQEVANAIPFDPSRKQRSAGPRKIAKAYLEAAQGLIDAGDAVIAGAVAQLSELLDRPIDVSDKESRLQVLAGAIADNELREKRERDEKLKAKYSAAAFASA